MHPIRFRQIPCVKVIVLRFSRTEKDHIPLCHRLLLAVHGQMHLSLRNVYKLIIVPAHFAVGAVHFFGMHAEVAHRRYNQRSCRIYYILVGGTQVCAVDIHTLSPMIVFSYRLPHQSRVFK